MTISTFTGIGARRRQEDAFAVAKMPEHNRTLAVIADGMGGHGYGDEASKNVVDAICAYWEGNPKRSDSEKKIQDAVAQAGVVYEKKAHGREMGSTLAIAAIEDGHFYIAHCGDSRIYVWRKATGGRFHTVDQTKITEEGWELVANAFFTGMCSEIRPEIRQLDLLPGDRVMLCTDGVFKYVPEAELWLAFTSDQPLDGAAQDLEAYCMALSLDNYTAILIEI